MQNEMTDDSPAGFDAREALAREVVAAVEAATPVDDREAAAKDAFLERTRLEIALEEAGVNRCRMSVLWSPSGSVHRRTCSATSAYCLAATIALPLCGPPSESRDAQPLELLRATALRWRPE